MGIDCSEEGVMAAFLMSNTDVTCPGHKDSSILIKMEKLILKGRGERSREM